MLGVFWGPDGQLWHDFGGHLVQGCTQEDPWMSKGGFFVMFGGFGVPDLGHFWVTF